jgi:hypothetical protein
MEAQLAKEKELFELELLAQKEELRRQKEQFEEE